MPDGDTIRPREKPLPTQRESPRDRKALSIAGLVVTALVVDVLLADTRAGASGATVAHLVVAASLVVEAVRRRVWRRVWRAGAVAAAVELGAFGVVVVFALARVPITVAFLRNDVPSDVAAHALRTYGAVVLLAFVASFWVRSRKRVALLARLEFKPVQTVVLSFGLAIVFGTLLLMLPVSVVSAEHVSMADAFFMATSAVCVTGLATVDVATTYTLFGQAVMLLLFQAGGLGIMFLFAAFALLSGRTLTMKSEQQLGEASGAAGLGSLRASLRFILFVALGAEVVGALLLFPAIARAGMDNPLFHALFHSVSAFCNAGFSTLPGGIRGGGMLSVIAVLVVLGGLGAPVLAPLWGWIRGGRGAFPLHARLALWTSGALLVVGFTGLLLFESGGAFAPMTIGERLGHAGFLSAIVRTGVFEVARPAPLTDAGALWLMMLMFVGASPGSTGGGIKTTTFAVVVLSFVAVLKRREEVTVFGRRVQTEDVFRSFALMSAGFVVVFGAALVLLVAEDVRPLALAFEVMSAFTTAGMSLGVTTELSPFGRFVIIAVMFVGRLGPLTLLAAFLDRSGRARVRYPSEKILFG